MGLSIKSWVGKSRTFFVIAPGAAIAVILCNHLGVFNQLEWNFRDELFRARTPAPPEKTIVVVTIDEADLKAVGDWPIPDQVLADLLKKIRDQKPRAIGLDLYRDLPEEPGHAQLQEVFRTTPNLIGVEKITGSRVAPPPVLQELGQVAIADLVPDADRKVRRGLLSSEDTQDKDAQGKGKVKAGLAAQVALKYLEAEGISLKPVDAKQQKFQLGKSIFTPLKDRDAGYSKSDVGGYQILMNWWGPQTAFPSVSMRDVLAGKVPPDLMRDRMVFIGSTATSTNDFFETPYSSSLFAAGSLTPGVVIHANLASQLVQGAIAGRTNLSGFSGKAQKLWILLWSVLGTGGSWALANRKRSKRKIFGGWTFWLTVGTSGLILSGAYGAFLGGLFVPVVPALTVLIISVSATTNTVKQQKLEAANRQLESANLQLEDTNGQLESANLQLADTNGQLESANLQLADTNQQLESTNLKLTDTNNQLEAANQQLAGYSKTLEVKTDELSDSLKQLQEAQLQLVQSEKMSTLGQLVAGVAHEINNPIGFITNNLGCLETYTQDLLEHVQLYQEQYPALTGAIADHAEEIDLEFLQEDLPKMITSMQTGVYRIKEISTSLRTFSRSDQQSKVTCNLHEGIDSTLLILGHRIKANEKRPKIQIVKEYAELPPVNCYPGQLNQVFMNILANAIDAMEEHNEAEPATSFDKIVNQITIQTELMKEGWVRIRIQDNGPGIPETVKAKIFEHLFTTKGVGKGTGLGLSISRQIIVEKHGGRLDCVSEAGQGTAFVIEIPIA